jgi:hypothetical protein
MAEAGSVLHNLPVPLTSLVGRARELERIGETLRNVSTDRMTRTSFEVHTLVAGDLTLASQPA